MFIAVLPLSVVVACGVYWFVEQAAAEVVVRSTKRCVVCHTHFVLLLHVAMAMMLKPGSKLHLVSSSVYVLTESGVIATGHRFLGCEQQQLDIQPLAHQASADSLHAVSRAWLFRPPILPSKESRSDGAEDCAGALGAFCDAGTV